MSSSAPEFNAIKQREYRSRALQFLSGLAFPATKEQILAFYTRKNTPMELIEDTMALEPGVSPATATSPWRSPPSMPGASRTAGPAARFATEPIATDPPLGRCTGDGRMNRPAGARLPSYAAAW
jgi:hypothetical protein